MGMPSSCFSLLSNCIAFRGWKMFSTNLSPPSCSPHWMNPRIHAHKHCTQTQSYTDVFEWRSFKMDVLEGGFLENEKFILLEIFIDGGNPFPVQELSLCDHVIQSQSIIILSL